MALHVDIALQIEDVTDMPEDTGQATMKHCGRSATADVEGCDGPLPHDTRVEVNLPLDRLGVPFCDITAIELFVIRAVRAYSLAEGDMKIDPERVDVLELLAKFSA
jgi:hypothetical protein